MTCVLLLRRGGRSRAGRLHRLWWPRGWRLPRTLLMLEVLPLGMLGATTSPTIIDADPISAVPGEVEDLVRDQPQIDLAPGGPQASGAQVPPSSTLSPRLP
jgi:hypothetical protein